ncbi:hypothetical protein MSG28_015424 [Choristoneura fumiferana]|uniref:Uncharacterized protein n=1 Tax=Choristoneura fumiferana TaxID=7141 RepID=A0ACC0KA84_CHOFU|nr:hypothetical protein MSG28_015424 [Choristoneura fumiferana]
MFNILHLSDDEDDQYLIIQHQKVYKERINFTFGNSAQFYEMFRMKPVKAERVLQAISSDIQQVKKGGALSPRQQLCTTLHWLGTGCQYYSVGASHGVDKSTVCRTVHRVINAINRRLFPSIVKWPHRIEDVVQKFYELYNFPNVIGIIDGTLIPIDAPTTDEPAFVDRKGGHSINCMMVCGPQYQFFYVSANWPGSVHDARVLRRSTLYSAMEQENIFPNGVILGDSGYPLKTWLMTPLHNDPNSEGERRYNRRLKATRQIIECSFGILKEKFPCLNHLRVNPRFAANIVVCCATLCNIARENEDWESFTPPLEQENHLNEIDEAPALSALRRQQEIIHLPGVLESSCAQNAAATTTALAWGFLPVRWSPGVELPDVQAVRPRDGHADTPEKDLIPQPAAAAAAAAAMRATAKPATARDTASRAASASPPESEASAAMKVSSDAGMVDSLSLGDEIHLFRRELQALRHELREFRQDAKVDALEGRVDAVEKAVVDSAASVATKAMEEAIATLQTELNERDQELLANDVQLSGVPEEPSESPIGLVMRVCAKLGVELDARDVVFAHRVGREHAAGPAAPAGGAPGAARVRDELLRQARVRRGAPPEGLGLAAAPQRFYANERLTPANRQLFQRARQAAGPAAWRFVCGPGREDLCP